MTADPPRDRLDAMYEGRTYFANPDFRDPAAGGYHGYLAYLADRVHIEAKFSRVLARVERHVEPGRLLDIGAGPGFLLAVAAERGWSPMGLEINSWAVEYARKEVRVDVNRGTIEAVAFAGQSFDAVTMMDLVEHLPDPAAAIERAAELIRRGGILAVLTPDSGSPMSRLLAGRWPEVKRVPEHLVLFSLRGLTSLLERHGFEVVDRHSVGKTSSIRTLIADVSPIAPRIGKMLQAIVGRAGFADHEFELDPRTKICVYARRR